MRRPRTSAFVARGSGNSAFLADLILARQRGDCPKQTAEALLANHKAGAYPDLHLRWAGENLPEFREVLRVSKD